MTAITRDTAVPSADRSRLSALPGLGWALLSAATFATSGILGKGLLDSGWSPVAAVTARVLIGGLLLTPYAVVALRGRWRLLLRNLPLVLGFGVLAVAVCQVAYFSATRTVDVGIALLVEYTAPVAVVGWLWLRGQPPHRLTVLGAVVALGGLVLVLDVAGGAGIDPEGALWSLLAMVGAAAYFVLAADDRGGLPPVVLAAAGLLVGGALLLVVGLTGVLPWATSTAPATYARLGEVPWWLPVALLGLVSAAVCYLTGIMAGRRLGARLASFIALGEVVFTLVFAWLALGQAPHTVQLLGGALVVLGVVVVRLAPEPPVPERLVPERPVVA